MFTDRWWIAKAAAALLLFAALSHRTADTLERLHPGLNRASLFTDDIKDKSFVIWGKKVLTADAQGFEVQSHAGPIRILVPTPPTPGEYVSTIARAVGPRTLRASFVQINAGWSWKRPLNYIVSALVVLAYLFHHRRLFRWSADGGILKGRY
jgi:hypothetical protein